MQRAVAVYRVFVLLLSNVTLNMELKRKSEDVTAQSGKVRCERNASIRNSLKESVNVINDSWISNKSLHSGQCRINLALLAV